MDPTNIIEHHGSPKYYFPPKVTRITIQSTTTPTTPTTTINFPISQQHIPRAVQESEMYLWVNSFYGPGTVGSWLLIICSVLISWTLNPRQRKTDHITNDFIAALMFPFIASIHLAFQLSQLPAPLLEVLTSPGLEMLQHTAAMAAPLNICEVFTALALLLFTIAAWQRQVKRAVLTFAVGVLSWSMVNAFYLESRAKNTERRELNIPPGSGSINEAEFAEMIIITGHILLFMVLVPIILIVCCTGMCLVLMKGTAVLSGLSTVVAFLIMILTASRILEGGTRKVGGVVVVNSQPFFIPRTDISIGSLDQMVALCGGCITLLFSSLEAFQVRRKPGAARNSQEDDHYDFRSEIQASIQASLRRRMSI